MNWKIKYLAFSLIFVLFLFSGCFGNSSNLCPQKSGYKTCGYCSQDAVLSDNPYAGQCRYCPGETTCSGTICGEITCKSSSHTDNTNGGNTQHIGNGCAPGYCWSNGYCCPSNARYYCEGSCYASQDAALRVSQGRCASQRINC